MHSYAWANASPAMDTYAAPYEDQPEQDDNGGLCIMPGCSRPAESHRLCKSHAMTFRRTGIIGGLLEKRRADFLDTACQYPDTPTLGGLSCLVRAALDYACQFTRHPRREPPGALTREMLVRPEVRRLVVAARTYADFDAEAPLSVWEAALAELEQAASAVAKALGVPREAVAA